MSQLSMFIDDDENVEIKEKIEKESILIIDTFGWLFRSYHALPSLSDRENNPTGLLTGFMKFLNAFLKKRKEKYIVFALEGKNNFRKDLNDDYKSNRDEASNDFKIQVNIILEWIEKIGLKTLQFNNYEADDVIASFVKEAEKSDFKTLIVSQDKDFMQLLNENTSIYHTDKDLIIDSETCLKEYKIKPSQFTDYQGLVGDSIDNIKGVKGIGKVTAQKLLTQFESLDEIYSNLEQITTKRTISLLEEGKQSAFESRDLASLRTNIFEKNNEKIDFKAFKFDFNNLFLPLIDDFIKFDIESMLQEFIKSNQISMKEIREKDRFNIKFKTETIQTVEQLKSIKKELENLPKNTILAFDTETLSVEYLNTKMVGFSFSFEENRGFYIPVLHKKGENFEDISELKEFLKYLLFNFKIVGQNIKFDMHIVTSFLELNPEEIFMPFADTMVLAWLINPEQKLSLDDLSYKFIKHKMIKFKDVVPNPKKTFADINLDSASEYAVEDAVITLNLYNILINYFNEHELDEVLQEAEKIEMPFVKNLYLMEQNGIHINNDFFGVQKEKILKIIEDLKQNIFNLCDTEFNLNSPKQMADVLFNKLELKQFLPKNKKPSTNEATLNSLKDKHKVINLILEYREKYKLLSTYIEPFSQFDNKIHSSFFQTGTATGRLSSRDPNLQNIPRNREEINIREGFITSDLKNKSFISLDYSQIELRFLAHFSEEPFLIKAFENDSDIHELVARKIFTISEKEEITDKHRNMAKTVNYGLIYGMGASKLATTLEISRDEAVEILEKYFAQFKNIKNYIQEIEQEVSEKGFIETIAKRRRYFENSESNRDKESNKREAFNSIFQGSVADLIKKSMNEIAEKIQSKNLKAKIILQIHDELLFEVEDSLTEKYTAIFKEIMENAFKLNVPIKVNSKVAKNWSFTN